ncbi:hypothetical protein ABWH92_12270 [Ahrensia marina]|uniref:hypothetical protein n=1 Tax=Ahrensia marina TaxID=1514904 RepID=UPI0035D0EDC9
MKLFQSAPILVSCSLLFASCNPNSGSDVGASTFDISPPQLSIPDTLILQIAEPPSNEVSTVTIEPSEDRSIPPSPSVPPNAIRRAVAAAAIVVASLSEEEPRSVPRETARLPDSDQDRIQLPFQRMAAEPNPEIECAVLHGRMICGSVDVQSEPAACDLCDQIASSTLAFTVPAEMIMNRAEFFNLALSPTNSLVSAVRALPTQGDTVTIETASDVPYTLRMKAELYGPAFEVSSSDGALKTVLPDRPTVWEWTVEPIEHGERQLLTLAVSAILHLDGESLPPSAPTVFQTTIPVRVEFWDRIQVFSARLSLVETALFTAAAIVLAVVGWIASIRGWKGQIPLLRRGKHASSRRALPEPPDQILAASQEVQTPESANRIK